MTLPGWGRKVLLLAIIPVPQCTQRSLLSYDTATRVIYNYAVYVRSVYCRCTDPYLKKWTAPSV